MSEAHPLPQYSGRQQCPKCAHAVGLLYCGTAGLDEVERLVSNPSLRARIWATYDGEVILRHCRGCRFCWLEAPADASGVE